MTFCQNSTHPPSPPLLAEYLVGAPPMPTVPLPPCPEHDHPVPSPPHRGAIAEPSHPRIHPVLSAASTVVRYNLARHPHTIRMSRSSWCPFFPQHDLASSPSASVLHLRCEVTGYMITVQTLNRHVTCFDLMVQLHRFFDGEMGREEWRDVRGAMRRAMKKAYSKRTGFAYSASARMKRIDSLCEMTTFKRIVPQYEGSTWSLQTC